jgi:hypothetical protein
LIVFCCAVALAAWQPTAAYSHAFGETNLTLSLRDHIIVAEATDAVIKATAPAAPPFRSNVRQANPQLHPTFLPAGIVWERGASSLLSTRLTVPMAVSVAAAGMLWLAVLLIQGGGLVPGGHKRSGPLTTTTSAPSAIKVRTVARGRRISFVWAMRYSTGAAVIVAVWWCVYTMPRDAGGGLWSEAQALHVAAASYGVALATILITFD